VALYKYLFIIITIINHVDILQLRPNKWTYLRRSALQAMLTGCKKQRLRNN